MRLWRRCWPRLGTNTAFPAYSPLSTDYRRDAETRRFRGGPPGARMTLRASIVFLFVNGECIAAPVSVQLKKETGNHTGR